MDDNGIKRNTWLRNVH